MEQLNLRRWSGQFGAKNVVATIRRTIAGRIAGGECLVVYDDGAVGLTEEIREKIRWGWPADKVRFSTIHPTLGGVPASKKKLPRTRSGRGSRRL
jgi:hypothetical protein